MLYYKYHNLGEKTSMFNIGTSFIQGRKKLLCRLGISFWQPNGIGNRATVIFGFPINCLPTQILSASYATMT